MKKTILLIEDNIDDRFLLKKFLTFGGYKTWSVVEKDRLSESIEFTKNNTPAIILLDLSLPDSVGEETFNTIYRNNSHIPIIVLTGLSDLGLAKKLIHKGAQDYLVKGEFDQRLLEKAIGYAIERHSLQLENNTNKERFLDSILEAQDKERSRIARELHDGVVQSLTAVSLNLSLIKIALKDIDKKALTHYDKCYENLSLTINEIREMSHSLMPRTIDEQSLKDSLEALISDLENTTKINLQFSGNLKTDPERKMKITVYRIVQELINNAIKHSEAENLIIQVLDYPEQLCLMVEDDGIGFEIEKVNETKNCFGLQSLKSRVSSLKGELEYDSKLGRGTNVLVTFAK